MTRLIILAPVSWIEASTCQTSERDGLVLEANPLKEMELKNHFQNEVG